MDLNKVISKDDFKFLLNYEKEAILLINNSCINENRNKILL